MVYGRRTADSPPASHGRVPPPREDGIVAGAKLYHQSGVSVRHYGNRYNISGPSKNFFKDAIFDSTEWSCRPFGFVLKICCSSDHKLKFNLLSSKSLNNYFACKWDGLTDQITLFFFNENSNTFVCVWIAGEDDGCASENKLIPSLLTLA